MKHFRAGFTLIEMSIVLIVISLILAGVLKTVGVQRQQLKRDETRQNLQIINQALIGFTASEGRLPCPDTDGDGVANPAVVPNLTTCDSDEGFLPFVDLGVGPEDAWGNRYRYRVSSNGGVNFADDPAVGSSSSFALGDDGDIAVDDATGNSITTTAPAIVVSFGKNGRQTITNIPCGAGVPTATEEENCNDDAAFIYDDYRTDFDDLVNWVSLTVLKNRMIEAAKLP